MQFNVSYDGTFPPIDHLSGCSHTIAAGEKMTNLDVARRPLSASVYGVTENSDYVVLNFGTGSQVTFIVDKIDEIPNGCEVRPYFDDKYIIIL
mgnify:CR=1 FL=1